MLNIGISKGRIEENFINALKEKNIVDRDFSFDREFKQIIDDKYTLFLTNSSDIIPELEFGCIDLGIMGSDKIKEINENNIVELLDLNTGVCNFALATLPTTNIKNIRTIASKYPNIAKRYLEILKINCEIIKMNGNLEVAPLMGYADAIIDLVQTGGTLKSNGLIELKRFDTISTKIITTKEKKDNKEIKELIRRLK